MSSFTYKGHTKEPSWKLLCAYPKLTPFNTHHGCSFFPPSFSLRSPLPPATHRIPTDLAMKLKLGQIFRSKSRSVSRCDPPSFGSGSSSSSDAKETPKSILPDRSTFRSRKPDVVSGEWTEYSPEVHWDFVEVFKILDKDGDGKISRDELEQVFSRLGCEPPSEEELDMMVDEADRDGDGFIDMDEFGALSLACGPAGGADLRDAFNVFDVDGDGRISAEELFGVFSALGDDGCTLEQCRRMIGGVDSDGDGFVCFEDFARMMAQQR